MLQFFLTVKFNFIFNLQENKITNRLEYPPFFYIYIYIFKM